MNKKQNERLIVNLIYEEDECAEILDSEKPDFLIRKKSAVTSFGVEVMEYYHSGSDARIKNISSYVSEIINQGRFRHKDDKTALMAHDVNLYSPVGEFKGSTKAILQQAPHPDAYRDGITKAITGKNDLFDSYNRQLSHVNLVIYDTIGLDQVEAMDFYSIFYTEKLQNILYSTKFREIFFITNLKDNRHVFVPLKEMLLVADYKKFLHLMVVEFPDRVFKDSNEFMILFAHYMYLKTGTASYRVQDANIEVVFGNCGVMLDGERLAIRERSDYLLDRDLMIPDSQDSFTFLCDQDFEYADNRASNTHRFSMALVFDVHENKQ